MFEGLTGERLRKAAVKRVEEDLTYTREFYQRMATDHDFYNGNQWEQGDIDYMRSQNREPLTFNICKPYVDHHVGADEDVRREPRVVSPSRQHAFTAKVWDYILQRIYYDTNIEEHDVQVDEDRTIGGLGFSQIIADIEPGHPDRIRIRVKPLNPFDVHVDFKAQAPDLSDAEYAFVNKWMTRREFLEQYPQQRAKIDELFGDAMDELTQAMSVMSDFATGTDDDSLVEFYDRRKDLIRVVHFEYKVSIQRKYLRTQDGGFMRVTDDDIDTARQLAELVGETPRLDIIPVWEHDVYWVEFVKDATLYEGRSPLPIDGFSITPMVSSRNRRTGEAHGLVHDLMSPQTEVNKRYSHILAILLQQQQPGTIIEEDAVKNVDTFEKQSKTPGAVRVVASGALVSKQIEIVDPPKFPDAPARMQEIALSMADFIAGKQMDSLDGPRGVEAAQTAMLHVRQSQIRTLRLRNNYRSYQKQITSKLMLLLTSPLISDTQLLEYLGADGRFIVRNGMIAEVENGEIIGQSSLADLRHLRWRIELDESTARGSERFARLEGLQMLMAAGVPVDPEEWIRATIVGSDQQQRMIQSAKQQMAQAAQAQQQQTELLVQDRMLEHKLKADSNSEKQRHSVQLEEQSERDSVRRLIAELLKVLEKADNDEKQFVVNQARVLQERVATGNPG